MARRVVFLRSKSVGGVEPRLDRAARALADAGHEVHAILWDREATRAETETRGRYTVHRVRFRAPYNRPSLAWKLPGWWRRAFRLLRTIRPDVVHAADWDTIPPAMRARDAWGAKVVFDIWDYYAQMITARIPRFVRSALARREAFAIRDADLVIVPDLARKPPFRWEPRRVIEIVNVPEERAFTPEPHEGFRVFYGGNLSKDRGLQYLIPACERAGARLVVAGQGPDEGELIAQVRRSASAEYLGYLPHDQVLRHAAAADAIPLLYDPSVPINRLASPNKLYEAMMLRKPVLVSEGILIADLVRDEQFGIVVPYGDTERLVDAMKGMIAAPDMGAAMGARGRAVYESRYRWEVMRERLVEAYSRL
ncbi:MAG: glycosyltransferase family 4 protein [Methanobacteriota archaeon]|nr:MAG: glycosyltransferase family 4 protein [Euryarchaeota archaeon]